MSVLINALERFEYWLWNNHPKIANSLSSVLTSEEINNMAQSLPFSLSSEIKELYQLEILEILAGDGNWIVRAAANQSLSNIN